MRGTFLFAVFALGLVFAQLGHGEPPARTDRYGDPLPTGVVARLGTQRLAPGRVFSLALSPNGRYLAAHDDHVHLWIWEVESGKEILRLRLPKQHENRCGTSCPVFSPDSKAIAVHCRDNALHVWEIHTGKEIQVFGYPQGSASCLVFSPDGRSLFASSSNSPILCWDLFGGGKPRQIGDFTSAPYLALSGDGKSLTAGRAVGKEGKQWLFARWDVVSGKKRGQQTLMTLPPWSGELSPDGRLFARAEADGKSITLLDTRTGRETARASDCHYPVALNFSADGARMTCRSKDGIVHVWDTATGKVRARFQGLSTSIELILLSPDGKRVALKGRADDAIHVLDVATGRELHSFAGHRGGPLTVVFTPDGKEIVTVSRDSSHVSPFVTEWADWSLRRWEAATGRELAVTRSNPKGEVYHATFSPDGRLLATVIHDGTLRLWDVPSGKELRSWKTPTRIETTVWDEGKPSQKVFKRPHPLISAPVFSPDGKVLLAAYDPKVLRWEVATGRELPPLDAEGTLVDNAPRCILAPDGQTLAVYRWRPPQQSFLFLDAATGKLKQEVKSVRFYSGQPVFSPDGRTFVFVEGSDVSLWEVASGLSRGRMKDATPSALAFSPDGRFLAAGDEASPNDPTTALLWDLATGQVAGRLRADCRWVTSLAFSPDGSRLAVAGYFPSVLVCDVAALCDKTKGEASGPGALASDEELAKWWAELSGANGARAYRAIRRLGLAGPRGAAFLKARLTADKPPEERRIAELIADLDADQFATREKAFVQLQKLGFRAAPALRRTLEGQASAEVRLRVKRLLDRLDTPGGPLPSFNLIQLRVVEALEANGSDEARQVLTDLAKETTNPTLAQEAKASLQRLARRPTR